jgi:hypothetical protein
MMVALHARFRWKENDSVLPSTETFAPKLVALILSAAACRVACGPARTEDEARAGDDPLECASELECFTLDWRTGEIVRS